MALSNTAIINAKPRDKNYRLYDEKGLYLEVTKAGGKLWRLKYRFGGKEKRLAQSELDIDGDGEAKALTDGLLLIRYLFGFSGDSLTAGAIGLDAERTTAEEIQAYIGDRVPSE